MNKYIGYCLIVFLNRDYKKSLFAFCAFGIIQSRLILLLFKFDFLEVSSAVKNYSYAELVSFCKADIAQKCLDFKYKAMVFQLKKNHWYE